MNIFPFKILRMEAEKFGGEILLEGEESLYEITKRVEGWTDCALKVFGRHKSEDGTNYPDHEHMKTLNLVIQHYCSKNCKIFVYHQ